MLDYFFFVTWIAQCEESSQLFILNATVPQCIRLFNGNTGLQSNHTGDHRRKEKAEVDFY